MITSRHFSLLFLALFPWLSAAQNLDGQGDGKTKFYAGISPVILEKDETEINLVHSLTSFWLAVHEVNLGIPGSEIVDRKRYSRLDHVLRVSHGFTENERWDLGADFQFTSSRMDEVAQNSPFQVFSGSDVNGTTYRGLATAGVRVRGLPFGELPELTLQGSFHFPVEKDEATAEEIGADRLQASVLATFYKALNFKTYYFLQADWRTHFASSENPRTTHFPQGAAYLVVELWNQQTYAFGGLTYLNAMNRRFRQVNQQLYGGLGIQYQAGDVFSVFLYGQIPFIFESGSQYVELVRESYSAVALGTRVKF